MGSVGAAETQYVGTDDSVALFQEHGDLVAPADGEVGPPTGSGFRSQYCVNLRVISSLRTYFERKVSKICLLTQDLVQMSSKNTY